jgi:hypothetical protein
MRTHVLILPVKGRILRTQGEGVVKIEQNFSDVLDGWALLYLVLAQLLNVRSSQS